jgi:hypothetical protein
VFDFSLGSAAFMKEQQLTIGPPLDLRAKLDVILTGTRARPLIIRNPVTRFDRAERKMIAGRRAVASNFRV